MVYVSTPATGAPPWDCALIRLPHDGKTALRSNGRIEQQAIGGAFLAALATAIRMLAKLQKNKLFLAALRTGCLSACRNLEYQPAGSGAAITAKSVNKSPPVALPCAPLQPAYPIWPDYQNVRRIWSIWPVPCLPLTGDLTGFGYGS